MDKNKLKLTMKIQVFRNHLRLVCGMVWVLYEKSILFEQEFPKAFLLLRFACNS